MDEALDEIDEEIMAMTTDDLRTRIQMLASEARLQNSEIKRLEHETAQQKEAIKENKEKIKLNKQLPYLVGNVVEVLDIGEDSEEEEDGGAQVSSDFLKTNKTTLTFTCF
jgi:26S proteasome regulatory subunit T5